MSLGLYVHRIDDNKENLNEFESMIKNTDKVSEEHRDVILSYPVVYIHEWEKRNEYDVYVGESNNIIQRTKQHYDKSSDDSYWSSNLLSSLNPQLFIIGYRHFNKSLTMDIENKLIQYFSCIDNVVLKNGRENPQGKYYTVQEFDEIFSSIWKELRNKSKNSELFPPESQIKSSAVFKASPLHKLTIDQEIAKYQILERVKETITLGQKNKLIFVEGEAGTGKTVLNSNLFYELSTIDSNGELDDNFPNYDCYLLVNHDEQLNVYEQIAKRLGMTKSNKTIVKKPTSFINSNSPDKPVDIVFVDEAHLLLTQGKYNYTGSNQLEDIIARSKLTIVMFDENQILTREQYWESQLLDKFKQKAKSENNYIVLRNQLRISADKDTLDWIDSFTKKYVIKNIPSDSHGYELKVFDSPEELEKAIKEKANSSEYPLSRIIATYDWPYKTSSPEDGTNTWNVRIGKWEKPWNRELLQFLNKKEKDKIKNLAWAEQPQTIDEVGSTFTIQGFDLNYAGVILGPSVKYREGKIIFDPSCSWNKKATENRTLSNGKKKNFGEELLSHEMRILMTRGVNGLYIYACDEELRKALIEAAK